MKFFPIGLFFVMLCFIDCRYSKTKSVDSFNTQNGIFDRLNITLIKPYKLIKVSDTEWRLELQTTSLFALSVHNIQGIDTIAGQILLYSEGGTEVNNRLYDELWFIIDPVAIQERSFDSYNAFEKALSQLNISARKVNLKKPDIFYNELRNKWKH